MYLQSQPFTDVSKTSDNWLYLVLPQKRVKMSHHVTGNRGQSHVPKQICPLL